MGGAGVWVRVCWGGGGGGGGVMVVMMALEHLK